MTNVYLILSIMVLCFVLMKKRNISLIVLYFFSTLVYYYNAFLGSIFIGKINGIIDGSYEIYIGTYIILFINLFIIFIALLLEKENVITKTQNKLVGETVVIRWTIIAIFILGLYLSYKNNIFFSKSLYSKAQLMEESGKFEAYYKYFSCYIFVYIFTQGTYNYKRLYKIISVINLGLTFYFGHRSYIVISVIAVIFHKIYNECLKESNFRSYIIKHKKMLIKIGLFFILILLIKGVTSAIFNGNWNLVYSRLTNIDYYTQVFKVSEPNTIITNLDTITRNHFTIPYSSYFIILTYIIPGIAGYFNVENFTYVYQRELYGSGISNRASTYLGEAYANGGYIMVFVIVLILTTLLVMIFKGYLKSKNNVSKTFFLLSGVDIAFYVHRNSLSFEASRIRAYLYITLLIFIFIHLVKRFVRIRH